MTTIKEQAEHYIQHLETRRRSPVKPNTLKSYASYLRTWIIPEIGAIELTKFENGAMKKFVAKLTAGKLSPASILGITNCVKGIIGSALDENGNELFPRKWNNEFVDLPILAQREQKAPTINREELERAISETQPRFKALYAVLAGSGLRISESLALRVGPDDQKSSVWLQEESKLIVRGQKQNGVFLTPKTPAGFREVDICKELNDLIANMGVAAGELLFPIILRTCYAAAKRDKVPGFHALRRWKVTRLREVGTPEDILKFWIGHASKDISDRYSKLAQNSALRKEWAEKAGLGFLPNHIL